jgi:hypothetical protein
LDIEGEEVKGVTSESSILKSQSAFSRIAWHRTDPFWA